MSYLNQYGRIRPFMLGLLILVLGLSMGRWWWQVGLTIIIVVFVDALLRYRTLD